MSFTPGPHYRDFYDMPDASLRSLANAMAAIGRGEKLKDVLKAVRISKAEGHIGQELAPDRVNGNANGDEG